MLPKEKRLNLKTDFRFVKTGKSIDSKYFRLMIKLGENTQPRIGIATSGKVFKNATDRNRCRRVISAAFEQLYPQLILNVNIIALPKKEVIEVKSIEITKELEQLLSNFNLLKRNDQESSH
jgi:ribonuclease P protein component